MIVKIPLSELEVGMVVVKFDKGGFSFPHYGKPFPDAILKQYLVRNGVNFAFVKQRLDIPNEDPTEPSKAPVDELINNLEQIKSSQNKREEITLAENAHPTLKELHHAIVVHNQAKTVTKNILLEARMGRVVDSDSAKSVVTDLVDHCIKSPEAFVNMTRLKDFDNYTFTHSVNVSVLSIAIGRRLGVSVKEMNNLGFAGLLHDIGKMMIPEAIINKPGKLTDDEFAIMKKHPELGYNYLKKDPTISEDILFAVRHHHEKSDGSGYPANLTEKDIPKFAKIVSIADVYDAVTTERSYHKGMMPSDALKMIFSWSGKHFNNSLVKFFISIMGIYPVGTLVVLNTNELAVIVEPNKNDPMRPKVLVISDNNMAPIRPEMFDLTSYNVVTQMPYKNIVSALDPKDFSIDTNDIIEQFLKVNKVGIV